jgi:uncharacterized membrane protein
VGFLYFGGIAIAVAFLLAAAFARSGSKLAAVVGIGVLLAIAWLVVGYVMSPTADEPRDCSDCGVYLGRWWEPGLALFVIGANLIAWTAGAVLGFGVRRLRALAGAARTRGSGRATARPPRR